MVNLITSYVSPSVIAYLSVCLTLWALSLYCLTSVKHQSLGRVIILGLIIGITTDVMIFWNPLFYSATSHFLTASNIGFRQVDALTTETLRFKKNIHSEYLAVGSSQTGALYYKYSSTHPEISILSMAGMGPLDFLLYRNIIKSKCSGTIILTLSDFDLCRKPMLLGAKFAPPQGFEIFDIMSLLRKEPGISYNEIQDAFLANIIDPYRYQYIFKGILDKMFARNKAFPDKNETALGDKEFLKIQLRNMASLEAKWLNINILLLDHFIAWAGQNDLKVVIVEGHYHPRAFKANLALHNKTSAELELLCKRYKNSYYVKNSRLYELTEDDYRDGYHVKFESGYKFAVALMNKISENRLP